MVLLYSIERLLVVLTQKLSNCKNSWDAKDFGTKGPTSCFDGCYFSFFITPDALRKGQSNISLLLWRWDTFEAVYFLNSFLHMQGCGVFWTIIL